MSTLATTGYNTFDGDWNAHSGRHALSEDAVLTPIFHALRRGGPRPHRPEPVVAPAAGADPVETFRQNPLTAPIPTQALVGVPSPSWRPELVGSRPTRSGRRRRTGQGRHHRRLEVVGF